ncbi:hypothetical protein EON64_12010 [archaeon]|nr:MAG: hypothetical protein EON64_12010 [archaeon]
MSLPYSASVDFWSIGCIMAELLNMQKNNQSDYRKRKPLFPGDSCGDLSNDEPAAQDGPSYSADLDKQLCDSVYNRREEIFDYNATMESLEKMCMEGGRGGIIGAKDSKDGADLQMDYPQRSMINMFASNNCLPVEPAACVLNTQVLQQASEDMQRYEGQKGQLSMILDFIGSPSYEDLVYSPMDQRTFNMLATMKKRQPKVHVQTYL